MKTIGIVLYWIGIVWMWVVFSLVGICAIWKLFTSESLWKGLMDALWMFNPFNIANFIAVIVSLSPGLAMIYIGERIKAKCDKC